MNYQGAGLSIDPKGPIKTLIVDDTAFMRKALAEILSGRNGIEVVGVARHGREALEIAESLDPDVITLDVDMPVMDGLTTIKHLMVRKPRPVVMVSGLADHGNVTLEALRLGAVDFFPKPSGTISLDMHESARKFARVVARASRINPGAIQRARLSPRQNIGPIEKRWPSGVLVLIAQEGACANFIRLIFNIDPSLPISIVAIQRGAPGVLASFCNELNKIVPWEITMGNGTNLWASTCFLAETDRGLRITGAGKGPAIETGDGTDAYRLFLPEVTGLFGRRCMIAIMGGADTAAMEGVSRITNSGVRVLALSPDTCVYGRLPQTAIETGMAEAVYSESDLWREIDAFGRGLDSGR